MESNSENTLFEEDENSVSDANNNFSQSCLFGFWPVYILVGLMVFWMSFFGDGADIIWLYLSIFCVGLGLGFWKFK